VAAAPALDAADRDLIARFERAGQGHVFRFLPELDRVQTEQLLADARSIDLDVFGRILREAADPAAKAPAPLEPPGDELVRLERTDAAREAAHARGLEEVAAGRVAVVVVAGGQGTRLGHATPKALLPVGPLSGKPLLQWHAEKVLHWSRAVRRPVPFVVLVSDATARTTEDFLRWHGWFGLDPTWVRLVRQRSLPAVDDDGRILLERRWRIALAPNGHGGVTTALRESRLLDLLADHGVRTLAYCQVDNPLVRTLDPMFVGMHVARGAQFSSKSVVRRNADEKVGVFGRRGGRPCVIEYSELGREQASAADARGELVFGQGNIAAHCMDVEFVKRAAERGLPFHRARKKVPFVDAAGRTVEPASPNATKFESFVFDAIPWAERTLLLETRREDEFSPIKNSDGEDSPETARRDLVAVFRRWYERAGIAPPGETLEVSPLECPDEHAFRRRHGIGAR
jgi:UDP-N-acetylglucosamine/UDP-N-acetylgalactosamine diphosphorylase